MTQHDYDISNASGATVRADINAALDAIVDQNEGATEPPTKFPNMRWYDTSVGFLKQRNSANTAWNLANDIGKETVWLPKSSWTGRTTNGAAAGSFETTNNKRMVETFDFDTAADEFIQTQIKMPKGWDLGTLIGQAEWSHPSTATNFGVAFFLQAVALANADLLDTAFGTAVSMIDTGGATDTKYTTPESAGMTVAGSPAAEELVGLQLYRDVSDAGDTLAVDARFEGLKLIYVTSAPTDD